MNQFFSSSVPIKCKKFGGVKIMNDYFYSSYGKIVIDDYKKNNEKF